ncbi:uncharacterized protein KY384_000971 [Bacidia gigantensis]|uniref:uncharacterized protein n=1 Tax=Bacidia gigantensis TaxID=2732470 RepID=UPI001D058CEF|nr:uncharacterized protein KY384_000971 [Bacidia gigantensis]KAG8534127.1 hypothetical protein KY384_000971 [Bacidia gigantensis]
MSGIQTHLEDSVRPTESQNARPRAVSREKQFYSAAPQPVAVAPTPTTSVAVPSDQPPPPQPGAAPQATNISSKASVPPPPKVGETPMSPVSYIPPGSSTTGTTSSLQAPVVTPPTVQDSKQIDLAHPPGYQQNPYATDMTAQQRSATQPDSSPSSLGNLDGRYSDEANTLHEVGEAVDKAKHWAAEKGTQLAENAGTLHGKVWDTLQGKK